MIEEKNKLVEKQVEEILKQGLDEDEEDQALEEAYHDRGNKSFSYCPNECNCTFTLIVVLAKVLFEVKSLSVH